MAIDNYFTSPVLEDVTSAKIRLIITPSAKVGMASITDSITVDYSDNILGDFGVGAAKNMLGRHKAFNDSLERSVGRITAHYEALIRQSNGNAGILKHDYEAVKSLSRFFEYGAEELSGIAQNAYMEKKEVVGQILEYNAKIKTIVDRFEAQLEAGMGDEAPQKGLSEKALANRIEALGLEVPHQP